MVPFEIRCPKAGHTIRLSVNIVDSNLMSHDEIRSRARGNGQFRKRISETRRGFFLLLLIVVVVFEISRNSSAPLRPGGMNFREPHSRHTEWENASKNLISNFISREIHWRNNFNSNVTMAVMVAATRVRNK